MSASSNGSGRTGVLFGLWNLQLKAEFSSAEVDVMEVILKLRRNRAHMVDSLEKVENLVILVIAFIYYLKLAVSATRGITFDLAGCDDLLSQLSMASIEDGYQNTYSGELLASSRTGDTIDEASPLMNQEPLANSPSSRRLISQSRRPAVIYESVNPPHTEPSQAANLPDRQPCGPEIQDEPGGNVMSERCEFAQPQNFVSVQSSHCLESAQVLTSIAERNARVFTKPSTAVLDCHEMSPVISTFQQTVAQNNECSANESYHEEAVHPALAAEVPHSSSSVIITTVQTRGLQRSQLPTSMKKRPLPRINQKTLQPIS